MFQGVGGTSTVRFSDFWWKGDRIEHAFFTIHSSEPWYERWKGRSIHAAWLAFTYTGFDYIGDGWREEFRNVRSSSKSLSAWSRCCSSNDKWEEMNRYRSSWHCSSHHSDAWLITAGTNAGVVKEVGEALSNYRYKNHKQGFDVPCIGIGSWGYTAGNEQLEGQPIASKNRTANRLTSRFTNKSAQTVDALHMVSRLKLCRFPIACLLIIC